MKNLKLITLILIGLFTVSTFAQKRPNKHKVVFQFTNANDTLQQKAFANQLKNLTDHWPNAKYEVVVYNMGLEFVMATKSKHIAAIRALHAKGVRFVVCENTMKNRKITKEQLIPEVEYVPAGIAEIVEKQEQGWSYIKGGF
ncbi:intracellular sulfur oxidation DsrE/DsrF family protein [Flavobacterium sp. CG_23.5]|uniref:DsrE family protein n=1 Tax=unclassified Flavobacterium TaxID=196869 RepID=UPI0018CBD3F5|nr:MULTISPECIES: DsrE family protein [unclassified Flavobacterium]MBG6111000.1 intracellular sulfur oxidation DsrE/DsrF family protein [Flavobacterium sp. CG_9.10]MBP2282448.1 intracellular sulfur oxidation DsrE/DsrF family protein [Flavobacterium sp. CG_23.5]